MHLFIYLFIFARCITQLSAKTFRLEALLVMYNLVVSITKEFRTFSLSLLFFFFFNIVFACYSTDVSMLILK